MGPRLGVFCGVMGTLAAFQIQNYTQFVLTVTVLLFASYAIPRWMEGH